MAATTTADIPKAEVKNLVREANVRIFSISMQSHTPALDKLAAESGGRAYQVPKLDDLPEAAAALSAEAHAEYVLGFTPPERQRDGKYHTCKVEVLQSAGEPPLACFMAARLLRPARITPERRSAKPADRACLYSGAGGNAGFLIPYRSRRPPEDLCA